MSQHTDEELAWLASEQDRQAWDELIGRHWSRVLKLFVRRVGSEADAEDLAIELFTRVVRRYKFRPDAKFTTYVHVVQRNLANEYFTRLKTAKGKTKTGLPDGLGAKDEVGPRDLLMDLHEAIQRLPERERRAIEHRVYGRMNYADIAQEMEVSAGTAHSWCKRARETLRHLLSGYGDK